MFIISLKILGVMYHIDFKRNKTQSTVENWCVASNTFRLERITFQMKENLETKIRFY